MIGAAIPCYNREEFIGTYLELLRPWNIKCAVALSNKPWSQGGNEESLESDRTEWIIRTYFPEVQIVRGTFNHHKDSFDAAMSVLTGCDRIITNDCDMYMTPEVMDRFIDFISQDGHDVFRINFETMIREYYYDWRYGTEALRGGVPPIMAVRQGTFMSSMISASSNNSVTWDEPKYQVHHFRFAKKNGSGKGRCEEPKAALERYKPAPEYIVKSLLKWQSILNEQKG